MSSYIDKYTSLFAQLEQMGTDVAFPDTHKAPMLLASIDPKCVLESTAAALRTKDASDLTWEYVTTTLIDEYNAKSATGSSDTKRPKKNRSKRGNKSKNSDKQEDGNEDSTDSEATSTTEIDPKALAMALTKAMSRGKSGSSKLWCEYCETHGHTEDRCFQNPENPNNKLSDKARKMYAGLVAKSKEEPNVEAWSTSPPMKGSSLV